MQRGSVAKNMLATITGSEKRWCCKDYFEARKIIRSILLCRGLKEMRDELRLTLYITTTKSFDLTFLNTLTASMPSNVRSAV
jgi:hypothetical protein